MTATEQLTGAQAIVRILHGAGVRQAFGIAGGKLSPLYRAMAEAQDWDYVGVRHEASAAFMATAIAAATDGELALCLGETGPGGVNLLSALGGAAANGLPLVAITSSNPANLLAPARGAFSSTDNERIFRSLVKWTTTVRDPARIPELVHRALRTALSGRPGPVHLDIPNDVLAASHSYSTHQLDAPASSYRPVHRLRPEQEAIARAVELLRAARRPLLIGGGGAVRSGAADAFRALARKAGLPSMTTQMGLGVIAPDDPNFLGQGGFAAGPGAVRALGEADLLIAVGCRFSSLMWIDGPPRWDDRPDRKLIQIDIDPEMLGLNIPLSLGLQGDARATLEAILAALGDAPFDVDRTWCDALLAEQAAYRTTIEGLADSQGEIMHPAALARAVGRCIGPEDMVLMDGGHTSYWSNDFTPAASPSTRFHEPGYAQIGFGLPWAVALSRRFPERRVFCLTGDGAFGFSLQELDTARRYGTRPVTIVHNNHAWGVIRFGFAKGGIDLGVDLDDTDYAAIARGFGCHGEVVTHADEVEPAIARALASGLPAVIDARVSFDLHPVGPIFMRSTGVR